MKLVRCLGLLVVFAWVAYACGEDQADSGPDMRRDFLSDVANQNIFPAYGLVQILAEALVIDVEDFCGAPEMVDLARVRESWGDLRQAWKRAEVFAFGPMKEYPWRYGPKIDLWPVRPEEIEETLLDTPWGETSDLSLLTGHSKGLPAIEYLIYGVFAGATDSESRFINNPDACVYLNLLVQDVYSNVQGLLNAWDPDGEDYLGQLVNAGDGSAVFSGLNKGFSQVINRMGFTTENMREMKLAKPAGIATGFADPTLLESRYSGRSLQDMLDNLDGIESVYTGSYYMEPGMTVSDLISQESGQIDADMRAALVAARSALEAFDGTLEQAIVSEGDKVTDLYERLTDLQRVIQVDLSQHLGVVLTFNPDNDGD